MSSIIGRITATENKPTSCTTLRFWVKEGEVLRPFDVVRIPHIRDSYTYAMVQELLHITDSTGHLSNFVSSDFGEVDVEPQNQRISTTIAEAEVLFNTREVEMPVKNGAQVEWADAEGIREALGLRAFKTPVPAGYIRNSNGIEVPVEFEAAYLLGPEGAHLNISGISGLATKTSYAMFLLNAIQQCLGDRVTMVIFNVKGNDLLSIDIDNPDLTTEQREEWKKCGLNPEPFQNVTYLYPYAAREKTGYTNSHADPAILAQQQMANRCMNYFYDVETARRKLPLLFSDIDDPNATIESIMHDIGDIECDSWDTFRNEIAERTVKGSSKAGDISKASWRRFSRLLRSRTEHDLFTERSVKAEKRHRLIREALAELERGDVLVIDIEPLPDYLQCLVVGDVIQTIYAAKLGDDEDVDGSRLGTVVIFADELNKYAPKGADIARSLTRSLLEVTERGRSLGVILFGAEQFRSGVHERVLGNCSTNVYGRTTPIEISKCPDFRHLSDTHKSVLSRLPQGTLLLQHAVFKTELVKVRFPHPCYYQPKAAITR